MVRVLPCKGVLGHSYAAVFAVPQSEIYSTEKLNFMNILFSAFINPERKSGVDKKIYGQIKAFEKLGHNVWYFTFHEGKIILHSKDNSEVLFDVHKNSIGYYLALEKGVRYAAEHIHFDMVYIRRIFCTPFHLKTLKMLKEKGIITVEELPTYPYDNLNKNYDNYAYRVAAVVDKFCRGGFKKHLDRFTTYSADREIFGVPAISLDNGIDLDNIKFTPTVFPKDRIDMIAVSAMASWHGYERVIEGLKNYYSTSRDREVYLHLVGTGTEDENWKELCRRYNLEKYVTFYGHRDGDELAEVFSKCQIGLGALGMYKANLVTGSPLKNREYMAMGKPYIYAHIETDPNVTDEFCIEIPNDASPVDIDKICEFYDRVSAIEDVSAKMNRFATKYFGWDIQMKKVLDNLPL